MRVLSVLLATAAIVGAQSPLTTTFADNNSGNVGNTVYFSLTALPGSGGVTINSIDLNCVGAGGVAATIDVYLQPNGSFDPAGMWVGPQTTGSGTTSPQGAPSTFTLATPLQLGEGCSFGVAIAAGGFAHAYSTLTNPTSYSTAELRLEAGSVTNAPFVGLVFDPRAVNANINYTNGGSCPDVASASSVGQGCVGSFTSFYELLEPAAMDLANTQIVATAGGTGFSVTTQASTIEPIGTLDATASPLSLGDDTSVAVGTLGLTVFSNCQVSLGTGNSTTWQPDVQTFLDNPATSYYAWTDLSPNLPGSGQVTYEELGTQWQVTYDGVFAFNTSDTSTVQFRGDTGTGDFTIAFGADVHTTGPEAWLVGFSVGGSSSDPGAIDMSSASLSTGDVDSPPLTLIPESRPQLGTIFDLRTANLESTAAFHMGIIGLTSPGTAINPLLPFIDAQCFLNASLDVTLGPDVVAGLSEFVWPGLDLTGASLSGFEFFVQSVVLDINGLNTNTRLSNGLRAFTGTL